MKLEQLKMFSTVAELGSLRAASDALFKTQAAVSQGISKLEQELSVTLFSRNHYRLALTHEGTQLYRQAEKVLKESDALAQMAQHYAQGNETHITIAFEASFDLSKILPILEKAQLAFPETQFILQQEYLSGALEQLMQQQADIALTPINPSLADHQNLSHQPLYQGALITLVSPKLLQRHQQLIHAEQLLNEYQILVKDSGSGTGKTNLGVQKGQRHWHVTDFSTKKMLILSGMGWGKLPRFLVQEELANGTLKQIELNGLETTVNPIYSIVKPVNKQLGPVGQHLWDTIVTVAEST